MTLLLLDVILFSILGCGCLYLIYECQFCKVKPFDYGCDDDFHQAVSFKKTL